MSSFNKYRLKGAYHYEWYETEDWYKWLIDRCVRFAYPEGGSTNLVVDVGCGEGLLSLKIADTYGEDVKVTGIDLDPDAIKLAVDMNTERNKTLGSRGRPIGYTCQKIEDWRPVVNWDSLVSINTIEHLDKPEALRDFIRDKINIKAIVTTIDYQGGALGEDHKFEWTYKQMMDFFKEFNPKGFRYKDSEWIGVEIIK